MFQRFKHYTTPYIKTNSIKPTSSIISLGISCVYSAYFIYLQDNLNAKANSPIVFINSVQNDFLSAEEMMRGHLLFYDRVSAIVVLS